MIQRTSRQVRKKFDILADMIGKGGGGMQWRGDNRSTPVGVEIFGKARLRGGELLIDETLLAWRKAIYFRV